MSSLLPDLTPRDSHSLWYTSSRNPLASPHPQDTLPQQQSNQQTNPPAQRRPGQQLIDRSPLAVLRTDEQYVERRRHNVSHFGSAWLKPPGIPKTLHQLREERREQDEHQEALRREQLAQELAEAEAEVAGNADTGVDGQEGGDGMEDVQLDGGRDLDDEIPEADDTADGFGESSDEAEIEEDWDEEGEERSLIDFQMRLMLLEQNRIGRNEEQPPYRSRDEAAPQDLEENSREQPSLEDMQMQRMMMVQRMMLSNANAGNYGAEDEVDEEDQAQILQEEDFIGQRDGVDIDIDMDADLDDGIPEGSAAYEHTDSDAEVSTDGDDQAEMSFAARAPQAARFRHSLARTEASRNSLAISDLLSGDGSSVLGSSPHVSRGNMPPPER